MNSKILKLKLTKIIQGQVLNQKEILMFYSVDSSSYQILPKIVVIPKNVKDVTSTVRFAIKNNIPIIPRGAGTGLVGSALGRGIVLDLKNLNKFRITKDHVVVEPGVQKGILDKALIKKKKIFGPNPSVGSYCSVGGMIGTNSSGSRSLRYGAIIDNLLEITIVTGRGKILKFPAKNKISDKIINLAKQIDKENFPNVSKNSCGYRLDRISKNEDLPKIIAGSEGTLGIVLSAKLKIYQKPKSRVLYLLGYDTALRALNDCQYIVKSNPTALEFIDENTIDSIPQKFSKKIKAMLFLEYDSNHSSKLPSEHLEKKIFKKISNDEEIDKWWKYRDSALAYSLKKISKNEKSFHIIEDGTVPLKFLNVILDAVKKIKQRYNCKVIIYGHAGNGNLHIRLIMRNPKKENIREIAEYYFKKIISARGTITGEHGDGLARSEFVRNQYGKTNYRLFEILKNEFDPHRILNPNKIISSKSMMNDLVLNSGLENSTIGK